jgi:hypothetical protein
MLTSSVDNNFNKCVSSYMTARHDPFVSATFGIESPEQPLAGPAIQINISLFIAQFAATIPCQALLSPASTHSFDPASQSQSPQFYSFSPCILSTYGANAMTSRPSLRSLLTVPIALNLKSSTNSTIPPSTNIIIQLPVFIQTSPHLTHFTMQ